MMTFIGFWTAINGLAAVNNQAAFGKLECLRYGNTTLPDRYIMYNIPKKFQKKGLSVRTIYAPNDRLKYFLKFANNILSEQYVQNNYAYGYVKGRNIVSNARLHTNKHYVCNLDLKDFFPSISYDRAYLAAIKHFKDIEPSILELCIKASCVSVDHKCFLAQGSPLSPLLSNVVCIDLDNRLYSYCSDNGFSYSRYADDMTFSTNHTDKSAIELHINTIKQIIKQSSFNINEEKCRIQSNQYNQSVTGLTVNEFPNVKKEYIKDLRNILYIWERYGYIDANRRYQRKYRIAKRIKPLSDIILPRMEDVIRGRIQFLKTVKGSNDNQYQRFNNKYTSLLNRDCNFIPTHKPNKYIDGSNFKIYHSILKDQDGNNYIQLDKFERAIVPDNCLSLLKLCQSNAWSKIIKTIFNIRPINKANYKWALQLNSNTRKNAVKYGLRAYNKREGGYEDAANLLRIAIELGNYNYFHQYLISCKLSNQSHSLIPENIEYLEANEYGALLKKYVGYYSVNGFKISPIIGKSNGYSTVDLYKTPIHSIREEHNVTENIQWYNTTGVGIYLGVNEYRCLDIDNVNGDIERVIIMMLHLLHLPLDYSWVIKSGSGKGFHIIFKAENIEGFKADIVAFSTNKKNHSAFERIELRWQECFLVLPPSLHRSGNFYEFRNGDIPTYNPMHVRHNDINTLLDYFCGWTKFIELKYNNIDFDIVYRSKWGADSSCGSVSINLPIEWLSACDSPVCANELATRYLIGESVSPDNNKAVQLFRKANNVLSAYNLASLIAIGYIDDIGEFNSLISKCKDHIDEIDVRFNKSKHRIERVIQIFNQTHQKRLYVFFDTETTGIPLDYNAPISDIDNWPRLVQLSWMITDEDGKLIKENDYIVYPKGFDIPTSSAAIHSITNEYANKKGIDIETVLAEFIEDLKGVSLVIGHNINFDINIVQAELFRLGMTDIFNDKRKVCTMKSSVDFCAIPNKYGYKWPTLQELHQKLFGEIFTDSHNALSDIRAIKRCYFELKKKGIL